MIDIKQIGDLKKTFGFLNKINKKNYFHIFEKYGRIGVRELSKATPIETGETYKSWNYIIEKDRRGYSLTWTNSHVDDGVSIVILIQYGHGTGTGGYVKGRDFINPALRPVFDKIIEDLWREVKSL